MGDLGKTSKTTSLTENVTFKFDAQFKKWFVAKFAVGTLNFNFSSQFDCALSSKPFLRRDKITIMTFDWRSAAEKLCEKCLNAEDV
jgi:hypothetical protein